MTDSVTFTDPEDIAFAKIAEGALFNQTTMPSGYVTPAQDMEMRSGTLVSVNRDEWLSRHSEEGSTDE